MFICLDKCKKLCTHKTWKYSVHRTPTNQQCHSSSSACKVRLPNLRIRRGFHWYECSYPIGPLSGDMTRVSAPTSSYRRSQLARSRDPHRAIAGSSAAEEAEGGKAGPWTSERCGRLVLQDGPHSALGHINGLIFRPHTNRPLSMTTKRSNMFRFACFCGDRRFPQTNPVLVYSVEPMFRER